MKVGSKHRVWAEIDLEALANNLRWIRYGMGDAFDVITVVKADAYGHGLPQIAGCLMQSGTHALGVANLDEASAVRSVGSGWPILMLGACFGKAEFEELCHDDVIATISSSSEADELSAVACKREKDVLVHLKVDTGMSRLGVAPERSLSLARQIVELPRLELEGVFTHLSVSEDEDEFTHEQLGRFRRCISHLRENGLTLRKVHVMNSGGIAYGPAPVGNMVRPGLLVYGIVPPGRRKPVIDWLGRLKPALSLKTRVGLVKKIGTGTSVSYGRVFVSPETRKVATICAGYGDGILRSGSGCLEVLIRGQRCRVLGNITMDQTIVDVSRVTDAQRGDEVVIIGEQGGSLITALEAAAACETIPWEILTSITQRVPRIYQGMAVA
ncbi:MAG: Alanine racemase 1 [Verrucomicrobia subdivision 3 bacterium]|nr:Alanine racemase 1 [Limisphaerales bacterium]MCS1413529.1 Alanine racemase 1 [Limisphaerales bacterium]